MSEPAPCPADSIADCSGRCIRNDSDEIKWRGDKTCDDGTYGVFFNCDALNCDDGDCTPEECNPGTYTFSPSTAPPASTPRPSSSPTLTSPACPEGQFADCKGKCFAKDGDEFGWLGDGTCDKGADGVFYNCATFECDKGDCTSEECGDGGGQVSQPTTSNTTAPGTGCAEGMVTDCSGKCFAKDSDEVGWLGDGTCDNGAYGAFFNCAAFECDKGDCKAEQCDTGVYTAPPTTISNPAPTVDPAHLSCPDDSIADCAGTCIKKSSDSAEWIGDGTCDDGAYGIFFNCEKFECDKGDCKAEQCSTGGVFTTPPTVSATYPPTVTRSPTSPRPSRVPTLMPVVKARPPPLGAAASAGAGVNPVALIVGTVFTALFLGFVGWRLWKGSTALPPIGVPHFNEGEEEDASGKALTFSPLSGNTGAGKGSKGKSKGGRTQLKQDDGDDDDDDMELQALSFGSRSSTQ